MTRRCWVEKNIEERVERLNRLKLGWANYFYLGAVTSAYRAIDLHSLRRLRQWLQGKHKHQGRATARYPDKYLVEKLGVVRLAERTRHFPWAKA